MIRRYSRPRRFTAGWTNPRLLLALNSSGFTTIPSPPLPVSSSHPLLNKAGVRADALGMSL